jgi:hypothetical protein
MAGGGGGAGGGAVVDDAVWPDGSPALDHYEPLEPRATWARVSVGAVSAVALLLVGMSLHRASAIETYLDTGDIDALDTSDDLYAILLLPSAAFTITAIVMFLRWFSRAYRNLPALGVRGLRFTPGWAVGAWFVPFLNLVRPKAIADDIWRASDPELPSAAPAPVWRTRRVAGFVHWWWGTYLLSFLLRPPGSLDGTIGDDDASLARWESVRNLLTVVAGILAIRLVTQVTERQRRRAGAA